MKLFLFLLLCISLKSFSHPGGLKKSGKFVNCHNDRKRKVFHCHGQSQFQGQEWESEKEAANSVNTTILPTLYSRKLFGSTWSDVDSDCQNTRAEILISRSLERVGLNKKGCIVLSGKWNDFYFNETHTRASDVDIDHVVPLKNAFDTGAANWPEEKRVRFANDPDNLVITNLKYNRQKGAKSPLEWLPVQKNYACKYLKSWISTKEKYHLTISEQVRKQYSELSCK